MWPHLREAEEFNDYLLTRRRLKQPLEQQDPQSQETRLSTKKRRARKKIPQGLVSPALVTE